VVWFAPSTAHDVIQSQQLKPGSEIIVKLSGKNKVELSILGKAAELELTPKSADNLKHVMVLSMRDAGEILATVPDLGFCAEDAQYRVESVHCAHIISSARIRRVSNGAFFSLMLLRLIPTLEHIIRPIRGGRLNLLIRYLMMEVFAFLRNGQKTNRRSPGRTYIMPELGGYIYETVDTQCVITIDGKV
jgi:hypothetical protein